MSSSSTLTRQRALVAALERQLHAQLIETHISWVLLAGRDAYKIKKAVHPGFLDFTTLAARRHFCHEELRLNRRAAPQLYLEVVAIGGSWEQPVLQAAPAIEYAVHMRRFAPTRTLDRLLAAGQLAPAVLDKLAVVVARFHAALPRQTAYGDPAILYHHAMQNFAQLAALPLPPAWQAEWPAVQQATVRAFEACHAVLQQRWRAGCVREGHGDLHLGNIVWLDDEPVPFDAIEFDPALRHLDAMDEVAFTMIGLLHGGRADLAWRYLNAYLEITGDYPGCAVLPFYLAYRAMVRAKVAALRAQQAGATLDDCARYMALARQVLRPSRPALIITQGLPGSGKTTFSQYCVQQLGAIRLRSDVERKRLFGLAAQDSSRARGLDIYQAGATRRTYDRLHELARTLLQSGYCVVVDAAFLRCDERARFRALAQELAVPFALAILLAPLPELRRRLEARRGDASEADGAVLEKLRAVQQFPTGSELRRAVYFTTGERPDSRFNDRNWRNLLRWTGRR
ncbi:MAG: bifunctional aminoglycoside phosphotransferase/ATP-binding protein [Sideroxydans sp.]